MRPLRRYHFGLNQSQRVKPLLMLEGETRIVYVDCKAWAGLKGITLASAEWETEGDIALTDEAVASNIASAKFTAEDAGLWWVKATLTYSNGEKTRMEWRVQVLPTDAQDVAVVEFEEPEYAAESINSTVSVYVTREDVGASGGLAVSVHYATANGTAIQGQNYEPASGLLSWAAGDDDAKPIVLTILDGEDEETEFTVVLSLATNAAIGVISTTTITIPLSIEAQLSGLSWQLPCLADWTVNRCGCPSGSEDVTTLTAPVGTTYEVTFRVRAVFELVDFVGGTPLGGTFYLNPTGISGAQSSFVNEYTLEISSPAAVYAINHGTFTTANLTVVDEELTVTIDAGATVRLYADAKAENGVPGPSPAAQVSNSGNQTAPDDDPLQPIVVTQPFDGQFAQIDVVSFTEL
jgi:hypothetical protein